MLGDLLMKTNFINSIHLGDSVNVLDYLIENDVKVNLTVTSPPYDDLRSYGKTCEWNFETFKEIANKLYKITEDDLKGYYESNNKKANKVNEYKYTKCT